MRKSLFICAFLLGACSGGSSDSPVLTFADFASPATTTEVLSDSSSTTSVPPATPETTGSSTTTTSLLVIDVPGAVAIRSADGFSVIEGRGAPQRFLEQPVAAAFDDLRGGVVFQLPGAGEDPAADQRIFWSRPTHPEAEPFLDVTEGSLLRLWGTEEIGGTPAMILTIIDDPEDPTSRVERLVAYDFRSADRVLGEVGGEGSGPASISYGGGRFLLEQTAGEQTFFEFRNDQGAVITLASNPHTGCAIDPTCPSSPVLDPSGSFVAYILGNPAEQAELVVHDLDLDEEIRRIALPGSLGEVISLDYDGTTVLINRIDPDGVERALIVDVSSSTIGEYGLTGRVQFLRDPPAITGPIGIIDQ